MENHNIPVHVPEDDKVVFDAIAASGAPVTPEEEEEHAEE